MSTRQDLTVRVTRRFDASPERLFDAWLDPKTAGKWLFAIDAGEMVKVEIDARVGGSFVFVDRREGEDWEHVGRYLELHRPRRLVFEFAVPKVTSDLTKVVVEIRPVDGGSELTLTQEMDPNWADWRDRTEEGWTMIVGKLASVVDR
ncbi:MAG: hypothetical protein QOJ65_1176 [Fimbriimonadaceae bacterium]|jgi:uncharacterized protein YndB with AHSA1/START domain|nr:hypothetical protein [Fimbriimonadaceae bacterium]